MNIASRAGIGLGSVALAGFGAKQFADFATSRMEDDHAKLQRATADSRQQWDTWKAKLDAEFPGGALPTPQDHARLKTFLQANPAPSFVKVEHDEFTRVRLSTVSVVDPDLYPVEFEKSNGYPLAFGAMMAIGGAAMLVGGVARGGGSTWKTVGMIAGGAGLAALGGASALSGVQGFRIGQGTEGASALAREINAFSR